VADTPANKTAGAIGVTTAILILGAIATNLKPLAEGGMALWLVLVAFTKEAPLGVSSFFLALGLGVFSRYFLQKYLPPLKCPVSSDFLLDTLAIAIGAGIMFGQLHSFTGALAGILAGLLVPYLARGIEALWNLGARFLKSPPT
jgi:hypothetical protein